MCVSEVLRGEEGRRSRIRIKQPWGEAAMPDTDVALCVGVHGSVPGMPEEPDVLLICDRFGVEDAMIDF